jgi:hypothetical protein
VRPQDGDQFFQSASRVADRVESRQENISTRQARYRKRQRFWADEFRLGILQ